eukprot:GHUV01034502.1.p1 GENE.GHUV01034502.1~~GHUV01034502.1.p1  ORF type:complete len:252 (+),score=77.20 GHUV01034502.1:583-1338(+)
MLSYRYPSVCLFRYHNMRNELFKDLREELKDSCRFVMGSNKVLQVALGKTPADELRTNLSLLSAKLTGQVGLCFTNSSKDEVIKALTTVEEEDFARAGSTASHDFKLSSGPLSNTAGPLPHTLEPQLRKYGLPTKLNKGVVELLADHVVCREGQVLDPNQAALLRVFNIKMATFRITPLAWWSSEGDVFEELAEYEGNPEDDASGDDMSDGDAADDNAADDAADYNAADAAADGNAADDAADEPEADAQAS